MADEPMPPALDLDALEAVALAADHGGRRWFIREGKVGGVGIGGYPQTILRDSDVVLVAECYEGQETYPATFAPHIVAFDPPTALALINLARSATDLQRKVDEVRARIDDWSSLSAYALHGLTERQRGLIDAADLLRAVLSDSEVRANAAAPSASPEGPRLPSGVCSNLPECRSPVHVDTCPRFPEGPDEGLRERITRAIEREAQCFPEVARDVADAVLPLLTAERERGTERDALRNRLAALETMLLPVLRQDRNEAEAERDEARERADQLRDLLGDVRADTLAWNALGETTRGEIDAALSATDPGSTP